MLLAVLLQSAAAAGLGKLGAALGLSHTSIIRKMKEYNLNFDKNN